MRIPPLKIPYSRKNEIQREVENLPGRIPYFDLLLVRVVALVTLGSGLFNLYSLAARHIPRRIEMVADVLPLEFVHLSHILTILIGFGLVISSINIYKRKLRAFQSVLALSILSVFSHLARGLHYEEALISILLIAILLATRRYFNVKSSIQSLPLALARVGTGIAAAILYGSAGFWFIERYHFHQNFRWNDAIIESLRYLLLLGDPNLVPYTLHAAWFLDSLFVMSVTVIVYAVYALYRPMIYRFRIHPRELSRAREIVQQNGRSALDFFKYWPDKSLLFSTSQKSIIAYRVGNNFAVALGNPVGPADEIEEIVRDFIDLCARNDWGSAFHQATADYLPIYDRLGLRKLKIGDDAIVDLAGFTLEGKSRKSLRQAVNRVEELGMKFEIYDPPVPENVISIAEEISDRWLGMPGHRERQFTLGLFRREYIRITSLALATDSNGHSKAFANLIPSYFPGEATVDLMRRVPDSPNGIMDFVLISLFQHLKKQGFVRFNMGLAPMSGFNAGENATIEEKAVHFLFRYLNSIFRFRGLKIFKSKYASFWEPRYAIYRSPLDLPRLALALREISEI